MCMSSRLWTKRREKKKGTGGENGAATPTTTTTTKKALDLPTPSLYLPATRFHFNTRQYVPTKASRASKEAKNT